MDVRINKSPSLLAELTHRCPPACTASMLKSLELQKSRKRFTTETARRASSKKPPELGGVLPADLGRAANRLPATEVLELVRAARKPPVLRINLITSGLPLDERLAQIDRKPD